MSDIEKAIPAPLNILLVEDDASSRMLFAHYLKGTPHRLVQAEDGEEALRCFFSGTCDLVFLDLHLPGSTGFEVLKRLRHWELSQGREATPVIMMSSVNSCEGQTLIQGADCSGFMPKPCRKDDILALVGRYWGYNPMEA